MLVSKHIITSVLCANSCTTCSKLSLLEICSIFRLLTELMSSARNSFSAVFDNCMFFGLNMFLKNHNFGHK